MTDEEWRKRMDATLEDIKKRMTQVEIKSQIDEVHRQNVESRLAALESRLGNIDGNLSRLAWLIIAGLLAAFVNFAVMGGLNVGP